MVVHARAGGGGLFLLPFKNILVGTGIFHVRVPNPILSKKNCDAGCKLFRCIIFE